MRRRRRRRSARRSPSFAPGRRAVLGVFCGPARASVRGARRISSAGRIHYCRIAHRERKHERARHRWPKGVRPVLERNSPIRRRGADGRRPGRSAVRGFDQHARRAADRRNARFVGEHRRHHAPRRQRVRVTEQVAHLVHDGQAEHVPVTGDRGLGGPLPVGQRDRALRVRGGGRVRGRSRRARIRRSPSRRSSACIPAAQRLVGLAPRRSRRTAPRPSSARPAMWPASRDRARASVPRPRACATRVTVRALGRAAMAAERPVRCPRPRASASRRCRC